MKNYNLIIDDEGVKINNLLINEEIFDKEMVDYCVKDRLDFIDTLIDWISEAHDRPNDLYLMKEDLKMLINRDDDFMLSSISTNEYLFKGEEEFNEICEEILKKNIELKGGKK